MLWLCWWVQAFWAESTENKIDPHPAAYERVYVNSSQLLEVRSPWHVCDCDCTRRRHKSSMHLPGAGWFAWPQVIKEALAEGHQRDSFLY